MVDWEQWWARNRYQYLEFPDLAEQASRLYPVTNDPENGRSGKALIEALIRKNIAFIRPLLSHDSARLRRAALLGLAMLGDEDSLPRMVPIVPLAEARSRRCRPWSGGALWGGKNAGLT